MFKNICNKNKYAVCFQIKILTMKYKIFFYYFTKIASLSKKNIYKIY